MPTLPPVGQAILSWAKERPPWVHDALRRLATQDTLAPDDDQELMALLYAAVRLPTQQPVKEIRPLTASDLGYTPARQSLAITEIRNVQNVNRLVAGAGLTFHETGLTVVYGPNGSGKTGFIRIFRTACRTRADTAKNQILADVTGGAAGVKAAEIVIKTDAGVTALPWKEGAPAIGQLMRIAVFDRKAAELYVDDGNQIAFLPFSLAIPFRLNDLILRLRAAVEKDRAPTTSALQATVIAWPVARQTAAQRFYNSLKGNTTDAQLDDASGWQDTDAQELETGRAALVTGGNRAADLTALAGWLQTVKTALDMLAAAVNPTETISARALVERSRSARLAASTAASSGFGMEPLPQVGEEVWQRLWAAAREYSTQVAYVGRTFPVTTALDEVDPRCVLCQQPLADDARMRLQRFEAFVSDKLNQEALAAEAALAALILHLTGLRGDHAQLETGRLSQMIARDPALAEELQATHASLLGDLTSLTQSLTIGGEIPELAKREVPIARIDQAVTTLTAEAQSHLSAADAKKRADLQAKVEELADRQTLHQHRSQLRSRRDLMAADAKYAAALDQLQTAGVTRKGNELLDTYLTKDVVKAFNTERAGLNITHLGVNLERRTDKSGASFSTKTQSKIRAKTSEIFSEGEQTALALAAFFTETSIAASDAPIIIDDPVCSLDRERCALVAARIVQAAEARQVIVFTHDLIFLNDLSARAEDAGVDISTCGIFRNDNGAGVLDPAGEPWKGKDVRKRVNLLRQEFLKVRKLHQTSPSEYERETKNIYSRLRDGWERTIEEVIFKGVVRRFSNEVRTRELRYVELSDEQADRIKEGMDKTSTHSHDNPAAGNVAVPVPDEVDADFAALEKLIGDIEAQQKIVEKRRKS
jgi:ABC-type lipoprotein export system ATPase subunit